jgi:hypothetical protein
MFKEQSGVVPVVAPKDSKGSTDSFQYTQDIIMKRKLKF